MMPITGPRRRGEMPHDAAAEAGRHDDEVTKG